MNWIEGHIIQIAYFFEIISQFLPVVLTVAVIFTFFLLQSFSRKLSRMSFYLDRIDNHLREINYLIKDYQKSKFNEPGERKNNNGSGKT